MKNNSFDDQFEKWLKTITKKLSEDENSFNNNLPKTKKIIHTDEFIKQAMSALKDEFNAEIILEEKDLIKVTFSDKNIFMIKVVKIEK